MRAHPLFSIAPLIVPVAILAGAPPARAQEWRPLNLQISNRSGKAWTVAQTKGADWVFGFQDLAHAAGDSKGPEVFDHGRFVIEPHRTFALQAHKIDSKGGSAEFTLMEAGKEHGVSWSVTLSGDKQIPAPALNGSVATNQRMQVPASERSAEFDGFVRQFTPDPAQWVIVSNHSILIMDRVAAGSLESKSTGAPDGKGSLAELSGFDTRAGMDDFATRLPWRRPSARSRAIRAWSRWASPTRGRRS